MVRIDTDDHVITNPVERMASLGLSIDWFRFWLKGHKDPDPIQTDQYIGYRELKRIQGHRGHQKRAHDHALTSNLHSAKDYFVQFRICLALSRYRLLRTGSGSPSP